MRSSRSGWTSSGRRRSSAEMLTSSIKHHGATARSTNAQTSALATTSTATPKPRGKRFVKDIFILGKSLSFLLAISCYFWLFLILLRSQAYVTLLLPEAFSSPPWSSTGVCFAELLAARADRHFSSPLVHSPPSISILPLLRSMRSSHSSGGLYRRC